MQHFTPSQLANFILKSEQEFTLLDVRESWEHEICHIDNSVLLPMSEIPNKFSQLNTDGTIVVICHHGIRSRNVALYLEHNGFQNMINLEGGIDAWAMEIDHEMNKY